MLEDLTEANNLHLAKSVKSMNTVDKNLNIAHNVV